MLLSRLRAGDSGVGKYRCLGEEGVGKLGVELIFASRSGVGLRGMGWAMTGGEAARPSRGSVNGNR